MSQSIFRRSSRRRVAKSHRVCRAIMESLEGRVLMHAGEVHNVLNLPVTLNVNKLPGIKSTTATGTGPDTGFTATGSVAVADLQKWHSRPGATAKVFLDFDGLAARTWGQYSVPTQTTWSTDSDLATFSTSEQQAIYEIWARVAEKYSPFNIDVTTEDPGNRTAYQTLDVVFCSDDGTSWLGSKSGGIAYINSFRGGTGGNTAFVFPKNLGPNSARFMAEAAAHESGHAFGLNHQSSWSGGTKTEYNPGNSLVAPIMGSSYSAQRGLWWNGTTTSATTIQDDLAILSSSANRFGYATDDHPNTVSSADALTLSGTTITGYGVIEQMTDADAFSFETGAGSIQVTVDSAKYGGMLDLKLSLYDNAGNLVAFANNQTLGETLNVTVAQGTYKLVVASNGNYGDLGQYSIQGSVKPVIPQVQVPAAPANLATSVENASAITLTWSDVAGAAGFRLERSTDGTNFTTLATLNAGVTTYTDANLPAATAYAYRVVAVNSAGTSPFSIPVVAMTRLAADANGDGRVDAFDLNILAGHWQQTTGATFATGDFNGDGAVDAFDLNILSNHWMETALPPAITVAAADTSAPTTPTTSSPTAVDTSATTTPLVTDITLKPTVKGHQRGRIRRA
jgi:hypothetical protein